MCCGEMQNAEANAILLIHLASNKQMFESFGNPTQLHFDGEFAAIANDWLVTPDFVKKPQESTTSNSVWDPS